MYGTADPIAAASSAERPFPRSMTIEFANSDHGHDHQYTAPDLRRRAFNNEQSRRRKPSVSSAAFPRTKTGRSMRAPSTRHEGFGGFPNPISIVASLAQNAVGSMHRTLTMQPTSTQGVSNFRTTSTFQRSGTIASTRDMNEPKPVGYITFDAIVGRNSRFRSLTSAQEAELGGVEYRALSVLWKIVLGYWLGFQFIAVAIAAPYLHRSEFNDIFESEGARPTWYTFFNVWSAFSNNGMSVLDSSMTKFNTTYLWALVLMVLILAGNTAFPIFLRLFIWTSSKMAPQDSQFRETCKFLLDHPRRCFLYLFPSYQTWFLVFVLVVLNITDWVAFLVLDIGNPIIEAIPTGARVLDGLFQATAVRAAGFAIVNIADTAPALQVLYVIVSATNPLSCFIYQYALYR